MPYDHTDPAGRDAGRYETCTRCSKSTRLFDPATRLFQICGTQQGWVCYSCIEKAEAEELAASEAKDAAVLAALSPGERRNALVTGLLRLLGAGRTSSSASWRYGWDYNPHDWWDRLVSAQGGRIAPPEEWRAALRQEGLPIPEGRHGVRSPQQEAVFWQACSQITGTPLGAPRRIKIA